MKIEKIENAWTVEITIDKAPDNDFSAYEYKTYAFMNWDDLLVWIKDKSELV